MPRSYRQLELDERRTIFRLLDAKVPVAAIASRLGRHRSTIHREIRRNHFHDERAYAGYFPLIADDLARERRQRRRKLSRHDSLRRHVVEKLTACWSPQQIAGRLRLDAPDGVGVCHETIYRYIHGPEGRELGLYRHLPKARRRRQPRHGRRPRPSFVPADRAIQLRPAEVEDRRTFGHWEADLLIFRREHGKANLTTLLERQTRYTILLANPDRRSGTLVGRIDQSLQGLPAGSCRSITFDRGTEFTAYHLLEDRLGAQAWFCDPHSPWQKGAVENANGRIRRFLPGERNPAELATDELARLVASLNATPRRCLGCRTPQEAFQEQLVALAKAA